MALQRDTQSHGFGMLVSVFLFDSTSDIFAGGRLRSRKTQEQILALCPEHQLALGPGRFHRISHSVAPRGYMTMAGYQCRTGESDARAMIRNLFPESSALLKLWNQAIPPHLSISRTFYRSVLGNGVVSRVSPTTQLAALGPAG